MASDGNENFDLIWGVDAIASVIGRSPRQTYDMCVAGHLPARQVGRRWVISRKKLVEFFTGEAA